MNYNNSLMPMYNQLLHSMASPIYPSKNCKHGDECPVCRAEKESSKIAEDVREKEYKERCAKYLQEFREKRIHNEI